MNISAPFVRRPIATALAALALAGVGMLAFVQLPVAPLPRVDLPTLSVSAQLPGASPEVMAASIASPLERRLGRISGVTEMTSSCGAGSCQVVLQFALERNIEAATRDVQAAINAASADLPANLPVRPSIRKINPADAPILILALTSPSLALDQIYDIANLQLAESLSQVEGVGQVFLGGGGQGAVRVQADAWALAAVGLTFADVARTVAAANLMSPQGAVGDGRRQAMVRAQTQLGTAADYGALGLGGSGADLVRLGDVAQVVDDVENRLAAAWVGGQPAVLMIVRRAPDANIIEVIAKIKALLPQLTAAASPQVDVAVALDRSGTITSSVAEVERTLVVTLILVVLVVWLFLGSWRTTLVPSVAVPLSLLGTFACMRVLGFSLNNFSLMALTISTGFVVDDAIVVTENISRHLEMGKSRIAASLAGAREIGFTIVSITLSLIAVFLPILLMQGVVGRLFREFAVTLSCAIALSAVISLTLTPMMASQLVSPPAQPPAQLPLPSSTWWRRARAAMTGAAWTAAYGRGLLWAVARPRRMLVGTLALVAASVVLFVQAPKGLFPQQDTGTLIGFSQASQDVSFQAMKQRQERINAIVEADPDVGHVVSFCGGSSGASGNTGTVFVELRPRPGRSLSADAIIDRLRPKLAEVAGISLFLQSVQDVRVGGRSSRSQYQYTLQAWRLAELRAWAPRLQAALAARPLLRDVNIDLQAKGLQLALRLDRDQMARLGVAPAAVDAALYAAFGQARISTIYRPFSSCRVILEAAPVGANEPHRLDSIFVAGGGGRPVPLASVASVTQVSTPLSIDRQSQAPAVTLSFNLAAGAALSDAAAEVAAAEAEIGLPESVRGAFAGTAGTFAATSGRQWVLLAGALACVYMVLGVLYESLVHPVTILSTLPSAGVGAMLALRVTGTELSIIALVGLILLVGIVKKNGIMMVDFALTLQRDGLAAKEAIVRASVARFRPIMMTTFAALFGSLPLALGHGVGSELRRPLGVTIVGGLVISQLLTLYTTPVVYLAMDRLAAWRPRFRGRPRAVGEGKKRAVSG